MKQKHLLDHFINLGKNLSIVGSYNKISSTNIDILLSLSSLSFLKFFRIKEGYVVASSEKQGKDIVTKPGHKSASGIYLLVDNFHKAITFYEINSTQKCYGSSMVSAVMKSLPDEWEAAVFMDYSQGFWEEMSKRYEQIVLI